MKSNHVHIKLLLSLDVSRRLRSRETYFHLGRISLHFQDHHFSVVLFFIIVSMTKETPLRQNQGLKSDPGLQETCCPSNSERSYHPSQTLEPGQKKKIGNLSLSYTLKFIKEKKKKKEKKKQFLDLASPGPPSSLLSTTKS